MMFDYAQTDFFFNNLLTAGPGGPGGPSISMPFKKPQILSWCVHNDQSFIKGLEVKKHSGCCSGADFTWL